MSHLIEDLERTLDTLRDTTVEFRYETWTQCGAGHLYHGATGQWASLADIHPVIKPSNERYQAVLDAVVEANNITDYTDRQAPIGVSVTVARMAEGYDNVVCDPEARAASIQLVEKALQAEKAKNTVALMDAHDQVLAA